MKKLLLLLAALVLTASFASCAAIDAHNVQFTQRNAAGTAWVIKYLPATAQITSFVDLAGQLGDAPGSKTWSDGSTDTIVWTWDRATGTDPTMTIGSNAFTFSGTVSAGILAGTTLTGAGGGLTLDASGFNGNLVTTDNTLQEVAQKVDDLSIGSTPGDSVLIDGVAVVDGGGVNLIGGTDGVDIAYVTGGSPDTATFNLDTTEMVGSRTFGNGSTDTIVWTWDRNSGTDPSLVFGDNLITTTNTFAAGILLGAGGAITVNAAGFDRNLTPNDNTLQEVAQRVDDILFDIIFVDGATVFSPNFLSTGDVDFVNAVGSEVTGNINPNSVTLTTDTTGNYAAGDAEAGAALTGDSATSFFAAGTLEDARLSATVANTDVAETITAGWTVTNLNDLIDTHGGAAVGATETVTVTAAPYHTLLLDENLTLTVAGFTNLVFDTLKVECVQDGTGTNTLSLAAGPTYVDGYSGASISAVTIDTTANASSLVIFTSRNAGATIMVYPPGVPVASSIATSDTADTTAFFGLWDAATGNQAPKTDAAATYNAATGAAAFTSVAAAIDGAAAGTTIKLFGHLVLTHPHVFAAGAPQQTTATANTYGQALFGNATDKATNFVEYMLVVPPDLDPTVALTGTFKIQLAAGDTGDHEYEISCDSVANSAPYSGTLGDHISLAYTADAAGASGDVETAGETTLTGWSTALTAGQLLVVRVARDGDHANDTSTQNSYSGPLIIKYGLTQ